MGKPESRSPIVRTYLKEKKEESGFTLVELLIVVLILGALASTVVVASGGFRTKGVEQACRAARETYETSFEAYRSDNADGMYPTTDDQVVPLYLKRSGGSSATASPKVKNGVLVRGKGWDFTIAYGDVANGVKEGSAMPPTFSAFTPPACEK